MIVLLNRNLSSVQEREIFNRWEAQLFVNFVPVSKNKKNVRSGYTNFKRPPSLIKTLGTVQCTITFCVVGIFLLNLDQTEQFLDQRLVENARNRTMAQSDPTKTGL